MTALEHFDSIYGPGATLAPNEAVFVVESPVESPRDAETFLSRLPCPLTIDGGEGRATGTLMHMPALPIRIGERLMLKCERWEPGT